MTTTRWCQSSVTAIMPFGQRTAREGRSSEPGPDDGPYVHTIRPRGVISSTRPGVSKPATRMSPFGSSWASDGYVVGVRTEKTSRPGASAGRPSRRSRSRACRRREAASRRSASGTSAAGRGRSCRRAERTQDPVRLRDAQDAAVLDVGDLDHTVCEPVRVVGVRQLAGPEPATPARPYVQTIRFVRRSICASESLNSSFVTRRR